ncbi:MAG: DNA translocase FtsK 4TM domain-containing protein [Candidatus Goldbacteria bacterium]|nr:DNA translocase FtsK 4TM domain-containing protein [Candidatus Goldiibacteriota bacterium]
MAKKINKENKDSNILIGLSLIAISVVIFTSFIIVDNKTNLLGVFGEVVSRILYFFIGKISYILPFIFFILGITIIKNEYKYTEVRYITGFILLIFVLSIFFGVILHGTPNEFFKLKKVNAFYQPPLKDFWKNVPEIFRIMGDYNFWTAGIIGKKTAQGLIAVFNIVGSYIVIIILTAISLILLRLEKIIIDTGIFIANLGVNFFKGIIKISNLITSFLTELFNNLREGKKTIKEENSKKKITGEELKEIETQKSVTEEDEKILLREKKKKEKITVITSEDKPKKPVPIQAIVRGDFNLPPTSLLKSGDTTSVVKVDYTSDAERLKQTLNNFGIEGEVVNVVDGPVISRFEIELATGVKVSSVENLATDIALAMKVEHVRIAPIAGKSLLGIEVPKQHRKIIYLREVIEDEKFQTSSSLLTIALGKDLGGETIVADLTMMPHLLIAGATGSGKSVCINDIIMSILFKATPDEVKFLMIDPKRVELTHYRDLPHLIAPVVTDPKHAAYVLKKLINEMDYRYEILAEEGAQNISIYNKMVEEYNADIKKDKDVKPEELKKTLPYIVVIIDELADLMLLAKGSVEESLRRLAQLARAVGIHLVLATQRPSVDVITGVIKANFPSRIAFQVMSQVDSRTILDTKGAETLLGRGDMLYAPADLNKPIRGQAALITGQEISKVVHFLSKQRKPDISPEFQIKEDDINLDAAVESGSVDSSLLAKAIALAKEKGEISTSYLQRKLGIGYSKAARLIDEMEEREIVTGPDGNKPRKYIGE